MKLTIDAARCAPATAGATRWRRSCSAMTTRASSPSGARPIDVAPGQEDAARDAALSCPEGAISIDG